MSFLCRMGRHSPLRDKQLIEVGVLVKHAHCRRCGVMLERDPGSPWRLAGTTKPQAVPTNMRGADQERLA